MTDHERARMSEADLIEMRQKWTAPDRPGGTIARDDVLLLLDEIERLRAEADEWAERYTDADDQLSIIRTRMQTIPILKAKD